MSYSRFGCTWPGGSDSWYIFESTDGHVSVWSGHNGLANLSYRDVKHLRDILSEIVDGIDESEWPEDAICERCKEWFGEEDARHGRETGA